MKTKVYSILTVLMLCVTFSFAKNPQSSLQQTIKNGVQFPSTAIEKHLEGAVFVEFVVKENGTLEIKNCHSLVGELQSYVFKTMSSITVAADPKLTGKTFLMRFDFKLI